MAAKEQGSVKRLRAVMLEALSARIVGAADVLRALADQGTEQALALTLVAESLEDSHELLADVRESL